MACLADESFGLKTARWVQRERSFLTQALIELKGFKPYPSSTNFLLVRIANNNRALELRSFLLQRKILVRACNSFMGLGSDHFRVGVRRRQDNRLLLNALREWTAGLLP
jgi:threonine-phosphate decarboxylase